VRKVKLKRQNIACSCSFVELTPKMMTMLIINVMGHARKRETVGEGDWCEGRLGK
jgi:hypothetical protein